MFKVGCEFIYPIQDAGKQPQVKTEITRDGKLSVRG